LDGTAFFDEGSVNVSENELVLEVLLVLLLQSQIHLSDQDALLNNLFGFV